MKRIQLQGLTALFGLFLGAAAYAGSASFGTTSGDAGTAVSINWSYTNGGADQGVDICLTWDADLSLTASPNCLQNIGAGFTSFSGCVTSSPNCSGGLYISMSPDNFTDLIPSRDPMGTLNFNIAGGATTGDILPITATCVDVVQGGSSVNCSNLTLSNGSVTVTESVAVLNVTPSTLNFGNQIFGTTSSAQTVTISNDGVDGIDMSVSNLGFTGVFSQSGGTCGSTPFTLADGDSCTVGIVFSPTAVTSYSGTFTVTSDASTTTNGSVALSGAGIPAPTGDLTISPEPFNFGGVIANSGNDTQSFTVSSSGAPGSVVTFASPSASLSGSGDFAITQNNCTGSLVAGSTCSIVVTFTPTSLAVVSTTLTVSGTDANSAAVSDTTSISGEGTPFPAGDLTISPTSYDFGSVVANEGTPTYTFTITSSGDVGSTVDISTVSVTGNGDFAVTSENCLGALAQGASCTVTVTYSPSAVATDNATLTVGGTDENTDAYNASATLAGEGTPFPAGALSISPTSHDFGGLLAGVEDDTQVFTVTSSGDTGSEVTISSVSLSVTGGSYSVTANTCSGALAQGATCSITVEFDPGTAGIFNVSLDVEGTDENADAADVSASITGEGLVEGRPTASPDGTNTANLTVVANTNGDASFEIDFGNEGNDAYFIECQYQAPYDANVFSIIPGLPTAVEPGATLTATAGCSLPDTETYQATLVCQAFQGIIVAPSPNSSPMNGTSFTYDLTCIGDATPIPATNRWGLLALALLMLGLAGWGVSRRAL